MKSLENQGFSFFLSYDMIESVTVQRQRNRLEKQRKSGVEKMSRVIVVTDSNSGITQSEAKRTWRSGNADAFFILTDRCFMKILT